MTKRRSQKFADSGMLPEWLLSTGHVLALMDDEKQVAKTTGLAINYLARHQKRLEDRLEMMVELSFKRLNERLDSLGAAKCEDQSPLAPVSEAQRKLEESARLYGYAAAPQAGGGDGGGGGA
jgi:hypothetical protein